MARPFRAPAIAVLLSSAGLSAQGPLAPGSSVVLDTNPTQGVFAYSSIHIPAGVVVRFSGDYAVQITCSGNAVIDGTLDVGAENLGNGPGAVTTGQGMAGSSAQAGYGCGLGWSYPAGDGTHASTYGSALPFDLAGGSPGGGMSTYASINFSCQLTGTFQGSGGGGTLVLEVQGDLDVHAGGRVLANGAQFPFFSVGAGSGGSILLRSFGHLTIASGAQVLANDHAPGFVRIDAYGQPPAVLGTVLPAPLVLTAPYLAEVAPPVRGSSWQLRVAAPRGDGVSIATSFLPGPSPTPFGIVGLDLASAILLAYLPLPTTGHDPLATFTLAIPNLPQFVGLHLHTAGLDWATALPPRVTNTIQSVLQ